MLSCKEQVIRWSPFCFRDHTCAVTYRNIVCGTIGEINPKAFLFLTSSDTLVPASGSSSSRWAREASARISGMSLVFRNWPRGERMLTARFQYIWIDKTTGFALFKLFIFGTMPNYQWVGFGIEFNFKMNWSGLKPGRSIFLKSSNTPIDPIQFTLLENLFKTVLAHWAYFPVHCLLHLD